MIMEAVLEMSSVSDYQPVENVDSNVSKVSPYKSNLIILHYFWIV